MIRVLVEFKSRLVWLWRLAASAPGIEREAGDRAALWVFDTWRGPDGYALRNHVVTLADDQNVRLISFGPRAEVLRTSIRFLALVPLLLSRRFHELLMQLSGKRIAEAMRAHGCEFMVVGAARGIFASSAIQVVGGDRTWEVQHGLLDDSYFPLEVGRFFARSNRSAAILKSRAPAARVEILTRDLDPPPGRLTYVRIDEVGWVACYSKNPGGGCTAAELAAFEKAVISLDRLKKRPLQIFLHPRDSILKLIVRHRSLAPCSYLRTALRSRTRSSRLVVSSYSSALTTNTRAGDYILNVQLGPVSEIVQMEYGWLPSVDLPRLLDKADRLPVFQRG